MSRPTIRQLWRQGAPLRTAFALAVVLSSAATGYACATDDDQAKIAAGEQVYNTYCATCHGDDLVNGSQTFDLRRLGADERPRFEHSVLNGRNQMPPWKGRAPTREQLDQTLALAFVARTPTPKIGRHRSFGPSTVASRHTLSVREYPISHTARRSRGRKGDHSVAQRRDDADRIGVLAHTSPVMASA